MTNRHADHADNCGRKAGVPKVGWGAGQAWPDPYVRGSGEIAPRSWASPVGFLWGSRSDGCRGSPWRARRRSSWWRCTGQRMANKTLVDSEKLETFFLSLNQQHLIEAILITERYL